MKAYIESHGCALNRGEALEFKSILRSAGWDLVSEPDSADLNVIATCAVIETTEKEMMKRVRHLSSVGKPLIVTGCMASVLRSKIEPIAPQALFVNPDNMEKMCEIVGVRQQDKWAPEAIPETFCHILPIASGCLGECSYCITRNARGELKSRPVDGVTENISRMDFSRGAREIQLTAQDTASYGRDTGVSLPDLLREVTSLDYDFKTRIGMMNPRTVMPILDDLVDTFEHEKIFKFLHLPIQSASDRILAEMNRGYTVEDFREIVRRFRGRYPEITLSTDLIVGYPDETRSDHLANIDFLESMKPNIVNITRFSPRPGTKAANGNNRVPGWVVKSRSRELTRTRFKISNEANRSKVGKVYDVIVTEKGTKNTMIARTNNYDQVILPRSVDLGQRVRVKINDFSPIHLIGYPA
ncbi:MAG TPA: tRNA (N(6)-L-threonylcarbamoyladenosine(37)-C(2))-methylthiotransferase [Euryarchaeota archaeon]|nr:tRNA (N(6)-L-threonylcarbamoyladenosine(37)-C(2))-methylthiotransferase [Euryarchaeota archaeon]